MNWNEVGGATNYCIYYKVYTGTPSTGSSTYLPCYNPDQTINTGDTSLSYTVTGLNYGTWYIFQIAGDSDNSCQICGVDGTMPSGQTAAEPEESIGVFIPESALKWEEYE